MSQRAFAKLPVVALLLFLLPVARADPGDIDPYDPEVVERFRVDTRELADKAHDAYLREDYEEAARLYLELLESNVDDSASLYNLACCYGLMGEAELAAMYLELSVERGFTNLPHMEWDPDFDPVRDEEPFAATMDSIRATLTRELQSMGVPLFIRCETFYPCRLKLPEAFDPESTYTLLVGLHGLGSNAARFAGLYRRFESPDFVYACPRAPYPLVGTSQEGYSWDVVPVDSTLSARAAPLTEEYVLQTVRQLRQDLNIDRVYLMGFSQGCGLAYLVGLRNPGDFDGLICFGGWMDRDEIGDDVLLGSAGLPVFIGHGTGDRVVSYEEAVRAREILEGFGYDVSFYRFSGAHTVPEDGLRAAREWMTGPSTY